MGAFRGLMHKCHGAAAQVFVDQFGCQLPLHISRLLKFVSAVLSRAIPDELLDLKPDSEDHNMSGQETPLEFFNSL